MRESSAPASDLGSEVDRVRLRFEALLAAGVRIASEHTLQGVLQRVVDAARTVVGARYSALGVLDAHGDGLTEFVTSGLSDAERRRIGQPPCGLGLLRTVIETRAPVRTSDIRTHPDFGGFPPHHPVMTSFLGVPIESHGTVYGNLYVTDKTGDRDFTEEDERVAVLLAGQAAVAIENARLLEDTATLLDQVRTMQRQRDQFFAMINHELRNALTGVYGWAEQLKRSRSEAATERATKEVYEAAERTIVLMNNLLDLSRLDAGKVQAVFKMVSVASVVERAISLAQPVADAKPVSLRADLDDPATEVHTDPLRLEQILHNLLTNAIRHSAAGEEVRVRVETTGDEIQLHVIDRGPGIPLDDQARIFEPFIRHDPESGLGSGLGLPVSRRLAEVLGGRLAVHSQLGRGATFTVSLPALNTESGA